jgi:hypothetical protein
VGFDARAAAHQEPPQGSSACLNQRGGRGARRGRRLLERRSCSFIQRKFSSPRGDHARAPGKWTEDRREHLIAANQERGQIHDVEVGFDETGRILALRDRFVHDTGAYTPYGIVVPIITSTQLPGPYRLPNYTVDFEVAYTNKAAVSPYRGAGRPHGAFVMERTIGLIAREPFGPAGRGPRRNPIQPHEPWDVGLTFQDGAPWRTTAATIRPRTVR